MRISAVDYLFNELWDLSKNRLCWHLVLRQAKKIEREQALNFYMWMRMNENAEKYLNYTDYQMFKEYLKQISEY